MDKIKKFEVILTRENIFGKLVLFEFKEKISNSNIICPKCGNKNLRSIIPDRLPTGIKNNDKIRHYACNDCVKYGFSIRIS